MCNSLNEDVPPKSQTVVNDVCQRGWPDATWFDGQCGVDDSHQENADGFRPIVMNGAEQQGGDQSSPDRMHMLT